MQTRRHIPESGGLALHRACSGAGPPPHHGPISGHPERSRGISGPGTRGHSLGRRSSKSEGGWLQVLVLLSCFLTTLPVPAALGNSSTWPGVPEWRALTNHITLCYRAITNRCEAIGRPDLYPDSPTYIRPMDDYANFAAAIDRICTNFVCTTNADANGKFDSYFSATGTNELPMWTTTNLHAAAAFSEWATNYALGIFVETRDLQDQIAATLDLLKWTTVGARPVVNENEWPDPDYPIPACYSSLWYPDAYLQYPRVWGDLLGWTAVAQHWTDVTVPSGGTKWPYATMNTGPIPNGLDNAEEIHTFARYCNVANTMYQQGFWLGWADTCMGGRHAWDYEVDVAFRGHFSGANEFVQIPDPVCGWLDWFHEWNVQGAFGPCTQSVVVTYNEGPYGPYVDPCALQLEWYVEEVDWDPVTTGFVEIIDVGNVRPLVEVKRQAGVIDFDAPANGNAIYTGIPSERHLYVLGREDGALGGHDKRPDFAWAPFQDLGFNLYTDRYSRVYVSPGTTTNAHEYFTGFYTDNIPYAGTTFVSQKGWAVSNGLWLIKWSFAPAPAAPAVYRVEYPDTDRDDIVDIGVDVSSFGPDTGTIVFRPEQDEPYVVIPLASTPVWYGGPPIHAYLSQGGIRNVFDCMGMSTYLEATQDNYQRDYYPVTGGFDDDGPFQAYSLNTRVLDSGWYTNSTGHVKQAAVLRPRGAIVVFDFPWNGAAFSDTGYPTGVNSNRSYVLRDATPWDDDDRQYDLYFESGVLHRFRAGLGGQGRLVSVGNAVRDSSEIIDSSHLDAFCRLPGATDLSAGIPAGRVEWPFLHRWSSWNSGPAYDEATDARYNVTWHRANGIIDEICYSTKDGQSTITVALAYTDGKITGISKTGVTGIDKSNATISGNGSTINYYWGNVTRNQTLPAGNARTVTIVKSMLDVSGTRTTVTDLNAANRVVEERLTVNGDTATTVFDYYTTPGRHSNGALKSAKIKGITYPDGAWEKFEYNSNGWLSRRIRPVAGDATCLTNEISYGYGAPIGGNGANSDALCELPRSIVSQTDGQVVGKTLRSYHCWGWDPYYDSAQDRRVTTRRYQSNTSYIETHTTYGPWQDYAWMPQNEQYAMWDWDCFWGYLKTGLIGSSTDPVNDIDMPQTITNGMLLTRAVNLTTHGKTETAVNPFGYVVTNTAWRRNDSTSSYVKVASAVAVGTDSFGRPYLVNYLDGTSISNGNYDLYGPQLIREIDGSQTVRGYCKVGWLESWMNVALDRSTTYDYDPIGNIIAKIDASSTQTRIQQWTFDAQSRTKTYAAPAAQVAYAYAPLAGIGTRTTITRPGYGDVQEDRFYDGRPKEISGSGSPAHLRYRYGVDPAKGAYTKEIRVSGTGAETEQTTTYRNFLGRTCLVESPSPSGTGIATFQTIYNSKGQPCKTIDAGGIVRLIEYSAKNEIEHAGLDTDANNTLDAAGTDRFHTYANTVSAGAWRSETSQYGKNNDATASLIAASESSLDGRTNTHVFAGRTNALERTTDYRVVAGSGGSYKVETRHSDGTRSVRTYEKWRPAETEEFDGCNVRRERQAYDYTGLGALRKVSDNRGRTVRFIHDSDERLWKVDPPALTTSNIVYTYCGNTRLLASARRSDGSTITYTYRPDGLLLRQSGGSSYDLEFGYDSQGRVRSLTTMRGTTPVVTEWERDPGSGLVSRKQIDGTVVEEYGYRANGQVASVVRPTKGVTSTFQYSSDTGDLVGKTYTDSTATITTTFDRLGRVKESRVLGGIGETRSYTLDGSVATNAVDGNGVVSNAVIERAYAKNHPGQVSISFAAVGAAPVQASMDYDAQSRVCLITNQTFGLSVSYGFLTNATLLAWTTWQLNGQAIMHRAMGWDLLESRLTNVVYAANSNTIASYGYSHVPNADRIEEVMLDDGSYWRYQYDSKDHLVSGNKYAPGGSRISGMQFGYDFDTIGNTIAGGRVDTNGIPVNSFQADNLNFHVGRVWSNELEIIGSAVTNARVTVNDCPADRQGERFRALIPVDTSQSSVETGITVYAVTSMNGTDTVACASGKIYVPKSQETVCGGTTAGAVIEDSRFDYEFNGRDQFTEVISSNAVPNFKLEFDYYPNGRRARTCYYEDSGGSWVLRRSHEFHYDRWNLIREEVSGAGFQPVSYHYLWGLDLAGQRTGRLGQQAGGIGGLLAIVEVSATATNVYLPISDHNGNIHKLLDARTQEVVANYEYSPFGVLIAEYGPAKDACPFRFMTKYYDAEIEGYNFGHREYIPATGKWLSNDYLDELQAGPNRTAFCMNDPVNNIDPNGLVTIKIIHDDPSTYAGLGILGRMKVRGQLKDRRIAGWNESSQGLLSSRLGFDSSLPIVLNPGSYSYRKGGAAIPYLSLQQGDKTWYYVPDSMTVKGRQVPVGGRYIDNERELVAFLNQASRLKRIGTDVNYSATQLEMVQLGYLGVFALGVTSPSWLPVVKQGATATGRLAYRGAVRVGQHVIDAGNASQSVIKTLTGRVIVGSVAGTTGAFIQAYPETYGDRQELVKRTLVGTTVGGLTGVIPGAETPIWALLNLMGRSAFANYSGQVTANTLEAGQAVSYTVLLDVDMGSIAVSAVASVPITIFVGNTLFLPAEHIAANQILSVPAAVGTGMGEASAQLLYFKVR